ncbi:MAG: UPF0271 protein [Parasphingorhabdus sp.]|jgi:UPF0271 protein
MNKIDLNADLGESYGPWKMGNDEALLEIVSSANVACGGHAGDNDIMLQTARLAKQHGVVIGSHPGFEDKPAFGRRRLPLTPIQIECLIAAQTGALTAVAQLEGVPVRYIKAHGALGLWAAEDEAVAEAIVGAVKSMPSKPAVLAISGTVLDVVSRASGLTTYSEIFADRGYNQLGRLVPRSEPGAMLHDANMVVDRILQFMETGEMPTVDDGIVKLKADSICVHGDGKNAIQLATELKAGLQQAGMQIVPFLD